MTPPIYNSDWRHLVERIQHGQVTKQHLMDGARSLIESAKPTWMELATAQAMGVLATIFSGESETLGAPAGRAFQRGDGAWERPFEKGVAIANLGFRNNVLVQFDKPMQRGISHDETGTSFVVQSPGGGLFLPVSEEQSSKPTEPTEPVNSIPIIHFEPKPIIPKRGGKR